MKRLFFLCALLCATLLSFAGDIIVTTDGQKLDVKITAVTHDQVTYKMPDYLDGPDFTIETSTINSIIFSNGQVKVYDHSKDVTTAPATSTTTTAAATTTTGKTAYHISYDGNSFFRNGLRMENSEYVSLLKTCPEAYNYYKKGMQIEIGGLVCACVGIPLSLAGIITGSLGGDPSVTMGLCFTGAALDIAAIPCLIVGFHKVHNSAEVYNVNCGKTTTATLKLVSGSNGVGLALAF